MEIEFFVPTGPVWVLLHVRLRDPGMSHPVGLPPLRTPESSAGRYYPGEVSEKSRHFLKFLAQE